MKAIKISVVENLLDKYKSLEILNQNNQFDILFTKELFDLIIEANGDHTLDLIHSVIEKKNEKFKEYENISLTGLENSLFFLDKKYKSFTKDDIPLVLPSLAAYYFNGIGSLSKSTRSLLIKFKESYLKNESYFNDNWLKNWNYYKFIQDLKKIDLSKS